MYKETGIVIFSALVALAAAQTAEAELQDLIIDVDMKPGTISSGDALSVTGRVVDHAYHPIRGAEVIVRTGSETARDFTSPDGNFTASFENVTRAPGTYTVNVAAKWYNMTGIESTQFQIRGDASHASHLRYMLDTEEARKYLAADEGDFEKDPIGMALFRHYHGLQDQMMQAERDAAVQDPDELRMEEQRAIAANLTRQAIEERSPSSGVFEGLRYHDYVRGLNPEIRGLVADQLNFTKGIFEQAQEARARIIAGGGTYEEAQKAYLEMLVIPKERLEEFNAQRLADD